MTLRIDGVATRGAGVALGISWGRREKGRLLATLALGCVMVAAVGPLAGRAHAAANDRPISVIVRAAPGERALAQDAVERAGGRVGRSIRIINAFVARVPSSEIAALRAAAGVSAVTRNASVHLDGTSYDPAADLGSMQNLADITGATSVWSKGYTGAGIDVALIDSGVVNVNGLSAPGKIVNGPDLSFEASNPNLRYLDTYGHGTFMAGIIAGRDDAVAPQTARSAYKSNFTGIAPDARIVSVKVANQNGATDVSQVLAAIDWVVQHRRDNGLNIRVLNLSFGTDSTQPYTLDPLAYAAEVAWRKGIVVVVSAGNSGYGNAKLNDPASDPYVIAVGASDSNGTPWTSDDTVPSWSARGDSVRNPDLVAPGLHVVSLRDPGSYIDSNYSSGYVNDRFFRGSGTSEAAAVVSGAAALVLQQRPNATPDQVKAILTGSAVPLTGANQQAQGAGELNLKNAANGPLPLAVQSFPPSTGTGTLEGARGSLHVQDPNGNVLQGEQDIFGQQWNGLSWSGLSWSGLSWSGGTWNNSTWTGNAWSGLSWSGLSWSGLSWSGLSWSGLSWSGLSWSNGNWDGLSWSGLSWSGLSWSGLSWSGVSWSGVAWS